MDNNNWMIIRNVSTCTIDEDDPGAFYRFYYIFDFHQRKFEKKKKICRYIPLLSNRNYFSNKVELLKGIQSTKKNKNKKKKNTNIEQIFIG